MPPIKSYHIAYDAIRGFTLTEFLIAGFLGSLLVLGMSHFIVSSWQASRYQYSLTDSQEAARTFFAVIEHNLSLSRATDTFPVNWAGSYNDKAGADHLSLSYASTATNNRNCLGNLESGMITNTYYIRPASDSPFESDDMMCSANNRSDTIVQHVELMKVRYGLDKGKFVNSSFTNKPDGLVDSWTTHISEAKQHKVLSMEILLVTKSRFRDKSIKSTAIDNIWGEPFHNFGIDTSDGYFRLLHSARFNFR